MEHEIYEILLPLAMILILSKILGLTSKKIGLPQVVGMILAGIFLGFIKLIPNQQIFSNFTRGGLSFIAKIGVVLIMFSAGLETNTKQFKKIGSASIVITLLGVLFPFACGFLLAAAFNGGFDNMTNEKLFSNLYYGTILTATSVSITVATLKELGKLNSKVGQSIVSAAIIDDIIGVVLLSLIIGLKNTGSVSNTGIILGKTVGFFVAVIGLGFLFHFLFVKMDQKWPHYRRIPIFGFALCFFYAYAAEHWFGVADITGAYFAGLTLSSIESAGYIDTKVETSNYLLFAPVFFANIGIKMEIESISPTILGFGFAFIAIALLGKIIGCGIGAKLFKFSNKEAFQIGIGMMVRAEVVLVCAQKGIDYGLVSSTVMPFIIILIILSSLIAPIILKFTFKNENKFLDNQKSELIKNTRIIKIPKNE